MKAILIMTLILTVWYTTKGKVTFNGVVIKDNLIKKFYVSLIISFIISLLIGLPIMGILYLIKM